MPTLSIGIVTSTIIEKEWLSDICKKAFQAQVAECDFTAFGRNPRPFNSPPNLIILNIQVAPIQGITAIAIAKSVLSEYPQCRLILLSALRNPVVFLRLRSLAIQGFIDGNTVSPEIIKHAINAVLAGRSYFSPIVANTLSNLRKDPLAFNLVLSDHQQNILSLIARFYTDLEISEITGLTAATIQSRRRDIMNRLNIHSTPKLIHYALTMGFQHLEAYKEQLAKYQSVTQTSKEGRGERDLVPVKSAESPP